MLPDGLSFDELNKLYDEQHDTEEKRRSMPYEKYFGEMDLSEEQIERRKETAGRVEEFVTLALMTLYYMQLAEVSDYGSVMSDVEQSYTSLLEDLGAPLTEFFSSQHPASMASDIVNTVMKAPEEIYNYTVDRAKMIAENEANFIWADAEFQDAMLTGKTRKRWSAIIDKRTRDTHREVNGTVVSISEPFYVGGYLMNFPGDQSLGAGAEEIVNCRCSVIYY